MAGSLFYARTTKSARISAKIRRLNGQFAEGGLVPKLARASNDKALEYLHDAAAEVLKRQIARTGRPSSGRTGLLHDLVSRSSGFEDVSRATPDKFEFFIASKADALMTQYMSGAEKRQPYWEVMETGTRYFVGKVVPVGFRSGGRMIAPDGGRFRMDEPVRRQQLTRISAPIPAYGYLRQAVGRFERGDVYRSILRRTYGDRVAGFKVLA